MNAATIVALMLVLVGVILALIDMFAPRPRLLHIAILLVGVGVLVEGVSALSQG